MRVSTEASSPSANQLQEIVTKNVRVLIAAQNVNQEDLSTALGIAQSGLSRKVNRRTDWSASDIANLANFFHLSFAEIVTPLPLFSLSSGSGSNYQLAHDVQVDNPQHELAGTTGGASAGAGMARYYRQPEGGEENKTHGAVGPRAFMMASLDADLIGPGAMGSRFSARSRFGCPRWDSNPHCADFEAASSTNWDTGACAQLWNYTT